MSTELKNPPAYPSNWDSSHNSKWMLEQGMSLRDYFAARAMEAIIHTNENYRVNGGYIAKTSYKEIAEHSYEIAQAMLDERNKYID